MNLLSWIVLGFVAWVAVAVALGLTVGSVIRRRDPHNNDDDDWGAK